MGYSKSTKALDRVSPILEILRLSTTDTEIPSPDPLKLMYALRDGLNIAKKSGDSPYRQLQEKFIFKIKKDKVIAELRNKVDISKITAIAKSLSVMTVPEVTDIFGVIGYALKHKAPKFEFPNANINGDVLKNLELWASKNNYIVTKRESLIILERNNEATDTTQDGGA